MAKKFKYTLSSKGMLKNKLKSKLKADYDNFLSSKRKPLVQKVEVKPKSDIESIKNVKNAETINARKKMKDEEKKLNLLNIT